MKDFEELGTCDPVHATATSYLFDARGIWRFGVEWLERRLA